MISLTLLDSVPLCLGLPAVFIFAITGLVWIFTVKARGSIDVAKHRLLPGPPPSPLIGNLMEFSGKHPNYMIEGCMSKQMNYFNFVPSTMCKVYQFA